MSPERTRERLLEDRRRLLAALRDCEGGKMNPTVDPDPVNLIRALQNRIAEIDDKIKEIDANGA